MQNHCKFSLLTYAEVSYHITIIRSYTDNLAVVVDTHCYDLILYILGIESSGRSGLQQISSRMTSNGPMPVGLSGQSHSVVQAGSSQLGLTTTTSSRLYSYHTDSDEDEKHRSSVNARQTRSNSKWPMQSPPLGCHKSPSPRSISPSGDTSSPSWVHSPSESASCSEDSETDQDDGQAPSNSSQVWDKSNGRTGGERTGRSVRGVFSENVVPPTKTSRIGRISIIIITIIIIFI